eukprot:CAMPEP_0118923764 /NCGR_PEP_ID=MMETSP1169-20130426/2172_1 /TAXON_ID=36882 /ORGANISM="Pyramimonas obovata, Strain CCMP722" /LENGTH=329 /DNA_ID=CAMNT_0006864801 /DNA_START=72 /DNA_END=1058 /DNA_ORIENTATION=+
MRSINQNVYAWVVGIALLLLSLHNAFVQNSWEKRVLELERTKTELRNEISTLALKITGLGSRTGDSVGAQRPASARVNAIRAANPNPTPLKPLAVADKDEAKNIMASRMRGGYGGNEDDPEHIGGFLKNDTASWEPLVWNWLIHTQKISSIIDIGCGSGLVPNYFHQRGVDVTCVEGSNEGVQNNALPADRIVQHDFTRGPWFPKKVVDVAYSVEFLEHLAVEHLDNVMATFKSARYIVIAASKNGGHYHANVHFRWWWIERMEAYGFEYSHKLTENVLQNLIEKRSARTYTYLGITGAVFRNPDVDFENAFKESGVMRWDRKNHWAKW